MLEGNAKVSLFSYCLEFCAVEVDCWDVGRRSVVVVECHRYCLVDVDEEVPVL